MKLLQATYLYLVGWFAHLLADFKMAVFWPVAAYVWEHCDYVAQSETGPYPTRTLYLRLVDKAIGMPNAELELKKLLSKESDQLLAYCLIALKCINRLNADVISKIHQDGLILVATGQFRVEVNLKAFAHDLMLRR